MAIFGFQSEMLNLIAGHSGKIGGDDADLIENLLQLSTEIDHLLKRLNNMRRDLRVGASPAGRGRDSVFESELGRVGQLRGEFSLLQNQLLQLKQEIPDLLSKLVDRNNNPINTGGKNLEQMQETAKNKVTLAGLQQHLSQSPYDTIQTIPVQSIGFDGAIIGLTALLYLVLAKMKQRRQ